MKIPTIGHMLNVKFLKPYNLSPKTLAANIGVDETVILDLLDDKTEMTPDLSIRLAEFYNMSDRFFMNMQNTINMRKLRREKAIDYANIPSVNEQMILA